jgi:hypothetical protein
MNMVEERMVTFGFNKKKPMELSNTIKSKIMQSTNQGYTMKGQWGQI